MTPISVKPTHLLIKNMVCNRCIKVVKEELEKIGLIVNNISLGEVVTESAISKALHDKIKSVLSENGFELIEDKKGKIVENIKSLIINKVHNKDGLFGMKHSFSKIIEQELDADYTYLSNLFSSIEGITIEHFIILQKIERAKELLKYGEITLSEIAYTLDYSSVQHLSNQFKKVTGLSASEFRKLTDNMRKPLDLLK